MGSGKYYFTFLPQSWIDIFVLSYPTKLYFVLIMSKIQKCWILDFWIFVRLFFGILDWIGFFSSIQSENPKKNQQKSKNPTFLDFSHWTSNFLGFFGVRYLDVQSSIQSKIQKKVDFLILLRNKLAKQIKNDPEIWIWEKSKITNIFNVPNTWRFVCYFCVL
jgi:hypothetical protein